MNINSTQSTTYTNSASSSNGFSGLASGIDTDSMVEAMLANTQNKIDKQNAIKQQIEWKQEIYRDIINKINTFQSTYFGTSSSSSLMNAALYNSMSAESTSKNFNVTATTSASVGNVDFEIRRLATNYSITSGSGVSGKLAGNINTNALKDMIDKELSGDYKVKFNIDGEDVEVDLSSVFLVKDGDEKATGFKDYTGKTSERDAAIKNALDTAFNKAGVNVTTTVSSGAISFSSGKKITVTAAENSIGIEKLGLKSGASSTEAKLGTHTLNGTVNAASTIDFTITLDDLSKDVKLDMRDVQDALNGNSDKTLRDVLQDALDKAHGTKQVQVAMSDNSFEFKVSAGRKVMIGGEKEVLDALGVKNGQSNRIGMGGALKDLYFANELQGSSFKFSINGVEFNFNENSYMSDVINEINKSSAGVRLVYRTQDDSFTLEAVDSGSGREIKIEQESGNLINALLGNVDGTKTGSTISSHALTAQGNINATGLTADEYDIKDGSQLTIKVDGKEYTFKLDAKKEDGKEVKYKKEELIEELQKQISKEDGLKDKLEMLDDGSIKISGGAKVEIVTIPDTKQKDKDLAQIVFGGAKNNSVSDDKKLSEYLTLKGDVALSDEDLERFNNLTLGDLKNGINIGGYELSYGNGKITAKLAVSTIDENQAPQNLNTIFTSDTLKNVFGTADVALGGADGSESVVVEGQNALIVVDGLLTERNSNNFSINGLNIDAKNITGTYTTLGDASKATIKVDGNNYNGSLESGWYLENGKLYDKDGVLVAENASVTIGEKNYATGIISDINSGEIKEFKGEVEEISVSRDTDKIVDTVKKFMDDYNKLIKELNDLVSEETSYREYAPLTEAQKKEMSEKEIELWEEKAKKGLLHGDSTITNLLQSMRSILYEKPEGSAYAIYNLGIETGEWESKGQLQFSENGETRLRQVLESDASGVQKLFADKTNGLFVKLNKTIDGAAKISSASPGALVQMAGVKGKATEKNNTLYRQLLDIESRIETLKDRYESEKTRYWNQFNSMEQLIANMNTQSSYIAQMLGY